MPVALAAAMLGPMAGPASAAASLPRQSLGSDMLTEVYEDWAEADYYLDDALAANNRGDWLAWGYYSEMAAEYQEDADDIYSQYHAWAAVNRPRAHAPGS